MLASKTHPIRTSRQQARRRPVRGLKAAAVRDVRGGKERGGNINNIKTQEQ
jgi:hypothetical protein